MRRLTWLSLLAFAAIVGLGHVLLALWCGGPWISTFAAGAAAAVTGLVGHVLARVFRRSINREDRRVGVAIQLCALIAFAHPIGLLALASWTGVGWLVILQLISVAVNAALGWFAVACIRAAAIP